MHGGAPYWHRAIAESTLPDKEKALLVATIDRGVSLHDFYVAPGEPTTTRGVTKPARPSGLGNARFPKAVQYNSQPPLPAGMGPAEAFMAKELVTLLHTGAIVEVPWGSSQIVAPVFVTPNSSETKLRLVYSATCINEYIPSPPVKFPRLGDLARWLEADGLVVVSDFASAYHGLKLNEDSHTLCGFRWEGREYQWLVLPFGVAPAVWIFQIFAATSIAFVRSHAHILALPYVDDTGGVCNPRGLPPGASQADRHASAAREAQTTSWVLAHNAYLGGNTLGPKKCQLDGLPVQRLLGLLLDAPHQAFVIPPDKVHRVQGFLKYLQDPAVPVVHVRTLERFAGLLVSLLPALPPVLMFLREVFAWVAGANKGGHVHVDISGEAARKVFQELSTLPFGTHSFGWAAESHAGLKVALATDASLSGYGAMLVDVRYKVPLRYDWAMPVPESESEKGIMRHEAMAICEALEHFGPQIRGQRVRFLTDNECVRYALQRWRGSRNAPLNDAAKRLYSSLLALNVIPSSVCRITTDDNGVPDTMSRVHWLEIPSTIKHPYRRVIPATRADLGASLHYASPLPPGTHRSGAPALAAPVFLALQSWYTGVTGCPLTIDVCASGTDRRLPRFVALEPWPETEGFVGTDIFSYAPAPEEHCYVNPPWAHLAAMLRHLRDVGAKGALVFPAHPDQIWFSAAMRAACAPVQVVAHKGAPGTWEDASCTPPRVCGPCTVTLMVAAFDFTARATVPC
jgi:hypothetical protein